MVEIFNIIVNFIGDIIKFIIYLFSFPKYLVNWSLALPPFISEGVYIALDIIITIIGIKIFVLIKEGIKP